MLQSDDVHQNGPKMHVLEKQEPAIAETSVYVAPDVLRVAPGPQERCFVGTRRLRAKSCPGPDCARGGSLGWDVRMKSSIHPSVGMKSSQCWVLHKVLIFVVNVKVRLEPLWPVRGFLTPFVLSIEFFGLILVTHFIPWF